MKVSTMLGCIATTIVMSIIWGIQQQENPREILIRTFFCLGFSWLCLTIVYWAR